MTDEPNDEEVFEAAIAPALNLTAEDYYNVIEGLKLFGARRIVSGDIEGFGRVCATREKIEGYVEAYVLNSNEPKVNLVTQDPITGKLTERYVPFSKFIEALKEAVEGD